MRDDALGDLGPVCKAELKPREYLECLKIFFFVNTMVSCNKAPT